MKLKKLAHLIALIGAVGPAMAQTTADTPADTTTQPQKIQRVEILGSSIKRIAKEGALPVEIITRKQLEEQGIVTAEEAIAVLNINGNGSDNLASNADVTSGAQRGNNGASSANLRGQGSDSTLVLLNGRRVATHGMKGSAVDLNSIPMAAVERIEVLKDGASAVYGTDAIGGVINFVLKKNYHGLEAQVFEDKDQHPGGNIYRATITGGWGDLDEQGWNVLVAGSHTYNQALRGNQRDFVNTFQPNRGLSVDTRGTPFGTVFATSLGPNLFGTKAPTAASGQVYNGVNILNLPGGLGCNTFDGMQAYDAKLWNDPTTAYGCAWDTGRAAVLQQPVHNDNGIARATFKAGEHQLFVELVGSDVRVSKSFSPNQLSPSSSTFPATAWYPKTGAAYDTIYNALVKVFPSIAANYGLPIAYRWRCMECGNRQIDTETKAGRLQLGAEGPINLGRFGTWDYSAGLQRAYSESQSTLGNGYNFTAALDAALGSGIINPFLMPGQTQSQQALDLIKSTSAAGVVLYGGKTTLTELDAKMSGEVMKLPAGAMMAAVGVDLRREEYKFNGDLRAAQQRPAILNAPFDDQNALDQVHRDIKAAYFEVLVPVTKDLELTIAGREDHYSGIGGTFNPKYSFRYQPVQSIMFRGSYNTGFRAPSFNQLFNGVTQTQYAGKDLVDPKTCPSGKVDQNNPACAAVLPIIVTGGKSDLQPETAKEGTLGVVWEPGSRFSANADLWEIRKQNTIDTFALSTMIAQYNIFANQFIRDASGTLVAVDQRWVNAGERITRGLELGARTNGRDFGGQWTAGIDASHLLMKKSRATKDSPYGPSEIGRFLFTGDLGLKWKATSYVTYKQGNWGGMLQNIWRSGYADQQLPGVANGLVVPPNFDPRVKAYSIFNLSVNYTGFKNTTIVAGIKNLFDKDPPFAVTYDSNTGAGSSWEPRVADPRGRSFTLNVNYKFF
ncbi:TonB-dependent receptor [Massilia terrae]|uniref:TonB-dependent receptor n=1 Tax=Massilia terrae TaxID=1811224 RepID=A0ABT2D3G5_9BURK|nr:TonB-dependent receptor [Massilia terrae]